MEWIHVEVDMPKTGEHVIVCGYQEKGDTELLTFYNTAFYDFGWVDEAGPFQNGETVAYWMPLPKPPEKRDKIIK